MKPVDRAPGGGARKGRGGKCPLCGKPAGHDHRPFCSRRCADIDLGRWLGGGYALPGEPASGENMDEES